jgi:hypothetical protein
MESSPPLRKSKSAANRCHDARNTSRPKAAFKASMSVNRRNPTPGNGPVAAARSQVTLWRCAFCHAGQKTSRKNPAPLVTGTMAWLFVPATVTALVTTLQVAETKLEFCRRVKSAELVAQAFGVLHDN